MKIKTILDTVFSCDCPCENQLSIGDFGDGQFTFNIKERGKYHEIVIDSKDIKKIIKLLNN